MTTYDEDGEMAGVLSMRVGAEEIIVLRVGHRREIYRRGPAFGSNVTNLATPRMTYCLLTSGFRPLTSGSTLFPYTSHGHVTRLKTVPLIFGTCPEAIKLAPVILEGRKPIFHGRPQLLTTGDWPLISDLRPLDPDPSKMSEVKGRPQFRAQ